MIEYGKLVDGRLLIREGARRGQLLVPGTPYPVYPVLDGVHRELRSFPNALGASGEGTNPEQLFAAGYATCFASTPFVAAKSEGTPLTTVDVDAEVDLLPSRALLSTEASTFQDDLRSISRFGARVFSERLRRGGGRPSAVRVVSRSRHAGATFRLADPPEGAAAWAQGHEAPRRIEEYRDPLVADSAGAVMPRAADRRPHPA